MPATPPISDLLTMARPERHAAAFAALDALAPGASFVLINDHAPILLLRRIKESRPVQFEAEFLPDGPAVWQVAITRNHTGLIGGTTMRLEPTETGFQIEVGGLAAMLGLAQENVQRLMREGQINSLSEAGQDADEGCHQITFRFCSTRVHLTIKTQGDVLPRTRTSVVPRSGEPIGLDFGSGETTAQGQGGPVVNAVPINDAGELTHYIKACYHVRHRAQLPQLILLSEMIEDLHIGDEGNPVGLSGILRHISIELEPQMKEEEQVLFPAVREGALSGIEVSIAAMLAKRRNLDRDIAVIRTITQDFTLPDAACTSWATLYTDLAGFIADITSHLRLETEILFPRFGPDGSG